MYKHLKKWREILLAKGYSEKTVIIKMQILEKFTAHTQITEPAQIRPCHITGYQGHITGKGYIPNTICRELAAVRDFLEYLREKGKVLFEASDFIEYPRRTKSFPKYILTEHQVKSILEYAHTGLDPRTGAVLELLYATGCRRDELINLDLYDFNISQRTLFVKKAKWGSTRVLPVTKKAVKRVSRYISTQRKKHDKRGQRALFLKQTGERIDTHILRFIFTKITDRLNLKNRLTPHAMRHAVATHLVARGVDIRYVQAFLGHADLSSTEIYTRIANEHLKEETDRRHPRNRMKI